MYPSVRTAPAPRDTPRQRGAGGAISANVIVLGATSFLTDISSEMVVAVVPLFLTAQLGFTAAAFGLYEGAYQFCSALLRLWGGAAADRTQRHKDVAATGYAISATTRLGLVASTATAISPVPFLLIDRVGKGLRAAPRDALISLSTRPAVLTTAFGVHRAMDTAGALIGPLLAFFVLRYADGAFDAVFVLSFLFAVAGVLVIVALARQPEPASDEPRPPAPTRRHETWRSVKIVLGVPGMGRLVTASTLLALLTVSDAFVYLVIQRTSDMSLHLFPLLFSGTAVAYLVLAVPLGRLADRVGRRPVYLAGHLPLVVLYAVLGRTALGPAAIVAALILLGVYYAATDGVLPAMVSSLAPAHLRARSIAAATVAVSLGRFVSAAGFGLLWQYLGRGAVMSLFAAGLALSLVAGHRLLTNAEASQ